MKVSRRIEVCCVDGLDGVFLIALSLLLCSLAQASGCSGRLHGVSSDDTSVHCSGIWVSVSRTTAQHACS